MTTAYNKLVRDRIPEIIRATGRYPVVVELGPSAARAALITKLGEEAEELAQAAPAHVPGELADLLEVVRALATEHQVPWSQVLETADRKAVERGGFQQRFFLSRVDDSPS